MKMITTMLLLAFGLLACVNVWEPSEAHYMSGSTEEYDIEVREGFSRLHEHDYSRAAQHFEKALIIPRPEVPNYEPILPLAVAQCRLGDHERGKALLKDFSCMLGVESGEIKCPQDGGTTFLEGRGTQRCLTTMCGEIFLAYYDDPTEDQRQRVEALEEDLNEAQRICK